jgi:hypothetical protein
VTIENGTYTIVEDWPVDDFAKQKIAQNVEALEGERAAVADLLG